LDDVGINTNFNEPPRHDREASMSDARPIVFVVDDDVSVRESLESLIRFAGWQPKTFASAQDFLSSAPDGNPSCLLLDIEMPGLSGLELQEQLAADRSEMPIVFLTGHGDIPRTVRAMKAGAVEFLTKPFAGDVLLQAIRRAIERSREALGRAAELRLLRERYGSLTRREREVMACVVAGLLNKEVAAKLGTSVPTIKAHRGKVMQKMKAGSLADLVGMAARLGLTGAHKT
jgi:FixJ family two-component response regulator